MPTPVFLIFLSLTSQFTKSSHWHLSEQYTKYAHGEKTVQTCWLAHCAHLAAATGNAAQKPVHNQDRTHFRGISVFACLEPFWYLFCVLTTDVYKHLLISRQFSLVSLWTFIHVLMLEHFLDLNRSLLFLMTAIGSIPGCVGSNYIPLSLSLLLLILSI